MMSPGAIDVHAHFLPPRYREALAEAQIWTIGGLPVPEWSPELAIAFMDAHGLAAQVLSISDPGVEFLAAAEGAALARQCNDYAAQLIAEQPRFGALAVLPSQDPDAAVTEAVRALDELGLDGVGLLSSSGGHYLGDPRYAALMETLDARNAWAFVHPTAPAQRPSYEIPDSITEYPFDTTRTIVSLIFNGLFARYPRIRWHFAHGGGTLPMHALRLRSLAANAREFGEVLGLPAGASSLDRGSFAAAVERSYFDTALVADPASLEAVRLLAGAPRIVFGSDWPFAARLYPDSGELQPAVDDVFSEAQAAAIRRTTAEGQLPRLARIYA
jgi:6-methylsalicylate decarboxylase